MNCSSASLLSHILIANCTAFRTMMKAFIPMSIVRVCFIFTLHNRMTIFCCTTSISTSSFSSKVSTYQGILGVNSFNFSRFQPLHIRGQLVHIVRRFQHPAVGIVLLNIAPAPVFPQPLASQFRNSPKLPDH